LSSTTLGTYSLFYISIAMQLVLLVYVIFLFPESLQSRVRQSSQLDLEPTPGGNSTQKRTLTDIIKHFILAFVSPITIFMPRTVDHGVSSRKDYNLLLLGSAMLVYLITTVRLFLLPLVYVLIVHDRASTSSNTCMQLILTIGTQFRYEETLH
jgi:hypothetical protein